MADVSSAADPPPGRPWQFSLRSLFALTFSVAIGLSFWKVTEDWYPSTLAALSFWIILGLTAQVRDLWRSIRQSGNLASDERWGLRSALVWRLALCCLIVASLVVRLLVTFRVLGLKGDEELNASIYFTTIRDLWDAVFVVAIIAAVASSRRLVRPRRRWPWTSAVNLVGLIAACVLLAARAVDYLCITFLVHATIASIMSAEPAMLVADSLDTFNPKRMSQFCGLTTAGVVSLVVSCVLLHLLSLRWRSPPWQRLGLGILVAASLAVTVLLAVRMILVEIPTISPVLAANISIPAPPRLAAAAALVLIVATVVARRWSALPAEHASPHTTWRRSEGRYHHERRFFAAILAGAAIAWLVAVVRRNLSFGPTDWLELGYVLMLPMGCLTVALALVAVQSVFSGWLRRPDATAAQQPRLAPGLFLLVWSALLTIVVCSAPVLGAWGLAFWIRSGF